MPPVSEEHVETATAEVVATEARPIAPAKPAGQVVKQAAAVGATTFVAGAGLAALIKGRGSRRAARRWRRGRGNLPIVATRSFLVDVHLLDPRR
jgi:hypothetical protein